MTKKNNIMFYPEDMDGYALMKNNEYNNIFLETKYFDKNNNEGYHIIFDDMSQACIT